MTTRRFKAQEQTIYRDLTTTMRKLGANSLRVPRDLMDGKDPQAEIVFDRAGRRYVVRCQKWSSWLDNFRASERAIYYLYRAIDEYGVTANEKHLADMFAQFFTAFEATPRDEVLMLGTGDKPWWEVLGIGQQATKQEIINAYRALSRVHHPDVGGDVNDFKRLRRAYEQACGQ